MAMCNYKVNLVGTGGGFVSVCYKTRPTKLKPQQPNTPPPNITAAIVRAGLAPAYFYSAVFPSLSKKSAVHYKPNIIR